MDSKNGEARECANTNRASIENNLAGNIDMNIVAKSDLNFHGIQLQSVESMDGTWLTASQIGYALQYADDKAVQRIYSRHAEEFTEKMTGVVKVTTPYGEQFTRVFSLRGAHLLAMFARTPVAKEFRRWVLDILDREVEHSPIAKQFTDEELVNLCYMQLWMEKSQRMSRALYPAMKEIGSNFSGTLYDMANETRYMVDKARESLAREAKNLDNNNFVVRQAAPMLAVLNGDEGRIH